MRAGALAALLFLAAGCAAGAFAESAPPSGRRITLSEAYDLALRRSEAIAQDQEAVKEALARVDELKSSVLPHLSANGTQTFQENPNIGGLSSINQTSLREAGLTLTQPLFSGFREFLAFKAGRKRAQSAALTQERAESLLYQDVARAYLDLLRLQRELEIRRSIVQATTDRMSQLRRWVAIGRSRESEVLAARAQLALVEAEIELNSGQERVSQEVLRFLTGLDEENFLPAEIPAPALEPEQAFIERVRLRSDVEAARRDLEADELLTKVSSRQRWPTIGFTGDYYFKRPGFQQNVRWDAIFGASLPLFDSGVISSQVKQAQARQRSSAQALSLAERAAVREVRSAYRALESTLSAARAFKRAAELAEANVKAQAEDYKYARVTNLEVLDSLTTLENTKITLLGTVLQAVLAKVQLEVASGGPQRPGAQP